MTTLKRTLYIVGFLLILAFTVPVSGDVWLVGHIFVSESDGSIHVYDNSGNPVNFANTSNPEILSVSGSALAGVDFESIYHLNATDLNSASTGFSAFRFPIPDPHTPPTVDFNTAGFSPGMAKQASSIRHDGLGNLVVGFLVNSPNFNLAEYSLGVNGPPSSDPPTAKFITTFPPESGETKGALGVAYMDLKASGTGIVYTSRSNCVHVFNVSSNMQESDFFPCVTKLTVNGVTVFGSKSAFDGVQLLSDGGLLVGVNGGGGNVSNNYVVRFNSSGSPTQAFTASATGPDVSVVLDPVNTNRFWAGSGTSLSEFDMSTCTISPCAPVAGPFTTAASIVNLAAFGTVSPAQPKQEVLAPVTVENTSPQTCSSNNVPVPCTLSSSTGNTIDFKVNFTTGTSLTLSTRDTTIVPAAGANDHGNRCTLTASPNCVVWKYDPNTFTGWGSIDMRYNGPGQTANTREFLDETTDETTGVGPTYYHTGSSVHSLNEVGGNNEGCFYLTPIDNPPQIAYLNNPGNITFRFQCAALGTSISELNPRLTILQISGSGTGIGTIVFPPPGTTGGTTPGYRLVDSSTFGVNVDSANFTGCFLATTFDDNHIASSFFAVFGVSVPAGSCTIPP